MGQTKIENIKVWKGRQLGMTNEIVISNGTLERSEADFLPSIKKDYGLKSGGAGMGVIRNKLFELPRISTTFSFYPFSTISKWN